MDMAGKTVLITGSTDGVGRYVAAKLAAAGANVLIHGRDKARAKTLADEIRREGHGEATFYQADLSSLAGARKLAESGDCRAQAARRFHQQCRDRIDVAGVAAPAQRRRPRTAVRRQLPFRIPARAPAASAVEGQRAVAHRQRRLARPASARLRRCHADQRLYRDTRLRAEQARADHVHHRSRCRNSMVPA